MRLAIRAAFAVLAWLAVPAHANEYDDFRIPEHRVSDWRADLSGAWRGSSGSFSSDYHASSHNGGIGTRAFWLRDSDPSRTAFSVSLNASGMAGRQTEEFRSAVSTLDRSNRATNAAEAWDLSAEHRWYPGSGVLGYSLSAFGAGRYRQRWDRSSSFATQDFTGIHIVDVAKDRSLQWVYQTAAGARLAAGAGRVRDATAVYDVQVLEQRLRASGALSRPLSDAARQRLIGLLYVRTAHAAVLDRAGSLLWREIATILAADGAVEGEVAPDAVLRALEPHISATHGWITDGIPYSPILRLSGWFGGVAVDANHARLSARSNQSSYRERTENDSLLPIVVIESADDNSFSIDDVGIGPLVEYHRPLGTRWQVGVVSRASFPIKDPAHGLRFTTSGSLGWLAADRWVADARFSHQRETRGGGTFEANQNIDRWAISAAAALRYYVMDELELFVSADETQGSDSGTFYHLFSRGRGVSLGLSYHLRGRIDAPGLMEPIRVGAF